MKEDLAEVAATAKEARRMVMNKDISVKEANAVAAQNTTILQAHQIDLRERMFRWESERQQARAIAADQQPRVEDQTDSETTDAA